MMNDMPPDAGEKLVKEVCRNSNLEAVWLSSTAIRRGGARVLGDYIAISFKLQQLSMFFLREFDEDQMAIIEGLKTNHSIKNLMIQRLHLAPSSMVSLAEVPKSHATQVLDGEQLPSCESGGQLFRGPSGLQRWGLDLSCNAINDIGTIRIARLLKTNMSLQKLAMSKNRINY
ncbi:hypothetical protein MTO96_034580 [Rhipicephalus appendiculatus]